MEYFNHHVYIIIPSLKIITITKYCVVNENFTPKVGQCFEQYDMVLLLYLLHELAI